MDSKHGERKELDRERVRSWFDTFVKDGCICQYCGFDGSRTPEDWLQLQGDHLIPRKHAGEHLDALNKVTACYYCNTIKRGFNPAEGEMITRIPNREFQRRLIEITRKKLEEKKNNTWRYGGGLSGSYQFMMKDLRQ